MPREIDHGYYKEYIPTPTEKNIIRDRKAIIKLREDVAQIKKELEEIKKCLLDRDG